MIETFNNWFKLNDPKNEYKVMANKVVIKKYIEDGDLLTMAVLCGLNLIVQDQYVNTCRIYKMSTAPFIKILITNNGYIRHAQLANFQINDIEVVHNDNHKTIIDKAFTNILLKQLIC